MYTSTLFFLFLKCNELHSSLSFGVKANSASIETNAATQRERERESVRVRVCVWWVQENKRKRESSRKLNERSKNKSRKE